MDLEERIKTESYREECDFVCVCVCVCVCIQAFTSQQVTKSPIVSTLEGPEEPIGLAKGFDMHMEASIQR